MANVTEHENEQINEANGSGHPPVVLVHGLWFLPSSCDRWRTVFSEAGYATLSPGWHDDPDTVEEANKHHEVSAHKTVWSGRRPLRRCHPQTQQRPRRHRGTPSAGCSSRSSRAEG